jgi:hypothetical protein
MADRRIRTSVPGVEDVRDSDDTGSRATLAARLLGRRYTEADEFEFIRGDWRETVPFRWRILTGTEKQECLAGACERFAILGVDKELRHYRDLEDEVVWQILFYALRDPDKESDAKGVPYPRPLFPDADTCRDAMSPDERDILVSRYLDFEERVAPQIGDAEAFFLAIDDAVKKKDPDRSSMTTLMNFGSYTLASYILTLESRLSNSQIFSAPTSSEESPSLSTASKNGEKKTTPPQSGKG